MSEKISFKIFNLFFLAHLPKLRISSKTVKCSQPDRWSLFGIYCNYGSLSLLSAHWILATLSRWPLYMGGRISRFDRILVFNLVSDTCAVRINTLAGLACVFVRCLGHQGLTRPGQSRYKFRLRNWNETFNYFESHEARILERNVV
jgi:hypothetical protein